MKTYTCVIVEDSSIPRILLEKAIFKHRQLELLSSFTNGLEALRKVNTLDVDIIFLDIDLPGINGFDFMKQLRGDQQIIIYSGNSNNALKAFEFGVTDFLLKPFKHDRFITAVNRAVSKFKLETLKSEEDTLTIKSDLKQVAIELNKILWVEALGDYVKVVTAERNHIVLSSLSKFNKRLPEERFLRIHKSFVINSKMIDNYNHKYIEINGTKLPVSRARVTDLDKILNYLS